MRFVLATFVLAVGVLTAGCATRSVASRSHNQTGNVAAASSVVTAKELAGLVRQGSLMDALERLRPSMLSSRGSTPLVSVDGSSPADLSILRLIPTSDVQEVRLQRASSSVGRTVIAPNGDVIAGDVIVVTTRSARR